MVPFPDAADRLSPSGPFLPTLSAGLVRGGSDNARESVTYPANLPFMFQRSNTPNDLIQIPLPNFRPGNSILTAATLSFSEEGDEAIPSVLVQSPMLNVGSQVFILDNGFSVEGFTFSDGDLFRTVTQVALWRPDPALITQDPVIGWFGVVGGTVPITITGGQITNANPQAWFIALEIGEDSITQLGPTNLVAVP